METFAWLSNLAISDQGSVVLATGLGYATAAGGEGASAAVADLRRKRGGEAHLLAASTLLYLSDGVDHRFVLVEEQPATSGEPSKWRFPAGLAAPGELPLRTACRWLDQEVGIAGEHTDWREVLISIGGHEVDFLTQDVIHSFRARYVVADNAIDFYYPMTLLVTAFDRVQLSDKQGRGRRVALLSPLELARLALDDRLTTAARLVVENEFADVLQVLRAEQKG